MWCYYRLIRAFVKEKRGQQYGWFWIVSLIVILLTVIAVIYISVKSGKAGSKQLGDIFP